jgi:hypothetical protein
MGEISSSMFCVQPPVTEDMQQVGNVTGKCQKSCFENYAISGELSSCSALWYEVVHCHFFVMKLPVRICRIALLRGRLDGFDIMQFADIDSKQAGVGTAIVDVTKPSVPDYLIGLVR